MAGMSNITVGRVITEMIRCASLGGLVSNDLAIFQ